MKTSAVAYIMYFVLLAATPFHSARAGEPASDQDDELFDEEFTLLEDDSDVVRSAARHTQEIGMSPSAVTVITRADISTSGADNLADLLRLVPGIDVSADTPFYMALSGRSSHSNENQHFLVLIDGREVNDDLAGTTFFMLQPIFLEDIERIEVVMGPDSTLYGANALAGVISITTRSVPERTSAWAKLSGGEPGAYLMAGRASTLVGEWGISLSGGIDHSGSYVDPTRLGRQVGKARMVVQGKLFDGMDLMLDCGYTNGRGRFATLLGRVDYKIQLIQPRLSIEARPFKAHLYYVGEFLNGSVGRDILLAGSRLASFGSIDARGHVVDGELQWDVPRFWKPLLLITGLRLRGSWIFSDKALSDEFDDPRSSSFHKPGMNWSELRAGGFLHAELEPASWLAITAGTRLDYDTKTGTFISPRLAAVFQPSEGHFLRLSAARSFRKPSFQENGLHIPVNFPPDSPIQGGDQTSFLEFMSRSIGNPDLASEKMWALEAGYRLRLLDGRLWIDLETYLNRASDISKFSTDLVTTSEGLPDLDRTKMIFMTRDNPFWIWGTELSLRCQLSDQLMLQAAWSHREHRGNSTTPKNLVLAGGRFQTGWGLLGSLYMFTRSDYEDHQVENPEGILSSPLDQYMPSTAVVLARLGYRIEIGSSYLLEIGVRLHLPIDLEDGRLSYHGRGGFVAADGDVYGGEALERRLTVYVEGSM